jgi:hypothetical protein
MKIVAYYHEETDEHNVTRKSVGLEKRETVVDWDLVLEREARSEICRRDARIAELERHLAIERNDYESLEHDTHCLRAELAALKARVPYPDFRPQLAKLVQACQQFIEADGRECFPERTLAESEWALAKDAHNASIRYAAPVVSPRALAEQDAAFKAYLLDCDKHGLQPDVAGAFNWAWSHAAPVVSAEQHVSLPHGYVLVPYKLTPEMIAADPYGMGYGRLHAIYSAMLAAAPAPSTTEGQGDE